MKYYIQFLVSSSGIKYDNKSKSMIKVATFPIDLLGSDGVYVPDGRYSLNTINEIALHISFKHVKNIIGYEIRRSNGGFSNYSTVKKVIF